ncbi:putative oxidoreductase YjgC [Deinococcus arenae]|uniref:Putative oxidoreductase YjgC n=1 Tax=Deinococcus arenae TaxID=1452751 RepID=A0A8H9GK44_9DEIO|nr:formate dehydrogenase subunit alpha [Deinococcus arenae]AWT35468.1 formate dehydrogenase subunit alpha [Deinococcus actinosclerus]GGM34532.1 putative oxidoreductase YjgC [Deinococcus arenae]
MGELDVPNDAHIRSEVGPTRPPRGAQVQVMVDGAAQAAWAGEPLVDVINRAQIELAQVCYHPQLGPIQTCDTCAVEIDGVVGRACGTPVRSGMVVRTQTNAARTAQRDAYDRIVANHDLYCTVCDNNNGNCTVHNTLGVLGIDHQTRPFQPKGVEKDMSNPFYRYDPDQCILCGRCVEACQNVQVNETLTIGWEMEQPIVLWDGGKPIGESSCVSCGHCITVCPCNALQEKSMLGEAGLFTGIPLPVWNSAIDVVKGVEASAGLKPIMNVSEIESAARDRYIKKTKTVCTYCGVGCSFDVWTDERYILKVEPGLGHANGISTCVKGKFGWDYVNSEDRLTSPLIRDGDRFREATWDEALDLVARRFTEIRAAKGPDALAFVASSKASNEEAFLVQKFARQVIGTNNVDNCSRYCQSPASKGLSLTVGIGGDSGTIKDIENASLVITVGSNTAESHPVLATRVKRAQKLGHTRVIVFDIREHELARRADEFHRPNPGTDFVWLAAVSKFILDNGLEDRDFLRERVNGLDEFRASIEEYTLERAERETGLSAATLEALARRIASEERVCILWAMGVTQQCGGTDTSAAISNLLLITGNYGRLGTGAYPLRGHNNVQGASDMGAQPDAVSGYQRVDDPFAVQRHEREWGVTLRPERGLDNTQMIDAAIRGDLRALWITGEEMSLTDANANHLQEGFEALEFLVVQDLYFTNTARFADVVLPAAASLEKEGTFTNTERRIQRLYEVMPPLKGTKPDWQIYTAVAERMGHRWGYTHPSEIMAEIARLTPHFAGVSYDRLEGYDTLCWPVAEDGTDQPLLYTERFNFPDGKARLYAGEYRPRQQAPNETYDLHLNSGRMLEHFHEGNMTFRVAGIAAKAPDAFVEISPELAAERSIQSGQWARLVSEHGAVRLQVLVTGRVSGNQVFVPMNARKAEDAVNRLTGSQGDATTNTPAYKDTRVRLDVLHDVGPNPLPATNPRWGHPTPQQGVEVERKWARPDYVFPGGLLPMHGDSLNARADALGADD